MEANKVTEIHQLSLTEIKELASATSPCLSILLPLEAAGGQSAQNGIRMKQAIEKAKTLLAEKTVESRGDRAHTEPD